MGSWNGLSLQSELSALLSDESTAFKARVSQWIRDIELDICSRHYWPFLRAKAKKIMTVGSEEQSLLLATASAPTVAIAAGGSLTALSTYKVRVTFYETISGIETFQGTESASVSATVANKTINLTSIPTAIDPLVTGRKVYLSKDSGDYFLHTTISDNTTTTLSITTETTSKIQPPDFNYISKLDGEFFIEGKQQLKAMDLQTLRQSYSDIYTSTTGSPYAYSLLNEERAILYPVHSTAETLSFYYFKVPMGIYPSADSIPTIPYKLKQVLVAGVEWKGYQYRDRDGKDSNESRYENLLTNAISRYGKADRHSYRIRDVIGTSDGYSIN